MTLSRTDRTGRSLASAVSLSRRRVPGPGVLGAAAAALLLALAAGSAAAQSPFVDVAPCHWAAESVATIAGEPEVDEQQARGSVYLVENSVRQVFEGLRCGSLEWSAKFLTGVPDGAGPGAELGGFALRDLATTLSGDTATVAFTLDATIDGAPVARAGSAELVFEGGTWRVRYADLAALGLPLFP